MGILWWAARDQPIRMILSGSAPGLLLKIVLHERQTDSSLRTASIQTFKAGKFKIWITAFCWITGLTIGALGIDSCAKETNKTGVCQNVVKAYNTFTAISGDYGQFPAPDNSLTFVSIDVQLEAEYSPIFKSEILSKKRCADKPCLHNGICHDLKPDGECCLCQSTCETQHIPWGWLLYLPRQIRFLIGSERVTCSWIKTRLLHKS